MKSPINGSALHALVIALAAFNSPLSTSAQCPDPKPVLVFGWLTGAYDTTFQAMKDSLTTNGLLPLQEPYTALGYQHVGEGGGEVFDPQTWPSYMIAVDWVIVELRDAHEPARRIASRSGIITSNGAVRETDGTPLSFCVPAGSYHVVLRHRNHLAVMTALPVRLDGGYPYVELTTPRQVRGGASALKPLNNDSTVWGLWPGNVNFDNAVKYTGAANDRDPILVGVGGTTPNNVVEDTYAQEDVNLDNQVKYTGQGNDRDILLTTVGSTTPNNARRDFIPTDTLVLRDHVYVMDDLALVLDTNFSDIDSNTVMRYAITGAIPVFDVDDIIIGTDPRGGYLRRITALSTSMDSLRVTTEQAGLSEVFASGTMSLAFDSDGPPALAPNSPHSSTGSTYFSNVIPIPFFSNAAINVRLEDVSLNASGKPVMDLEFGPDGLKAGEIATREISVGAQFKFKIEGSVGVDSLEWAIVDKLKLAGGFFAVGPVPIFYDIFFSLKVVGKIEFLGQVNTTTEVDLHADGSFGMRYSEENGWQDLNTLQLAPPTASGEVTSATLGVKTSVALVPEIMLKLYKIPAGPYFSTGPELGCTLRASSGAGAAQLGDHDLTAKAIWKTKVGAKIKMLDKYKFDRAVVFESAPFVQFKTPARIDTATTLGNHQIAAQGTTLPVPLSVHVVNELTSPLFDTLSFDAGLTPVNFQVVSGGGAVTNERVFTDLDGKASTTWTLGLEPLSAQRLKAWVQNGVGDTIALPVKFVVDSSYWSLQAISPNSQSGSDGTPLWQDLQVRLINFPTGEPVSGADVHFQLVSGGGSLSETIVTTSSTGDAATSWTLPLETTTPQRVKAYVLDFAGDTIHPGPVYFDATFGGITAEAVGTGADNSGTAGSAIPIQVRLGRSWGASSEPDTATLLSGKPVQFQLGQSDGTFSNVGTAMTGPDGIAIKIITLPQDHGTGHGRAFHVNTFGDTAFANFNFYVCDACPATVTDVDGNTYPVVNIGCQCWTAKNLETTHFKNGDLIPLGTNIPFNANDTVWGAFNDKLAPLNGPARGAKFFDVSNTATYGWLYNARAVTDGRGICPNGWKMPTVNQWLQLIGAAGDTISGDALRANSTLWTPAIPGWNAHLDTYGFAILPGLSIPTWCCPNTNPCCIQTEAEFLLEIAGYDAYFWTQEGFTVYTCHNCRELDVEEGSVVLSSGKAYSCRCILDE